MENLLPVLIFILVLVVLEFGYFALRSLRSSEKKNVRRRLKVLAAGENPGGELDVLRKDLLSQIPWLNRVLKKFQLADTMRKLLDQAGTEYTLGLFVLSSLTLTAVGFLAGIWVQSIFFPLLPGFLVAVPFLLLFGIVPWVYLIVKKKKRFKKFEAQLPEALDLISRSLKAGHALSSGIKMVADEMANPLGDEFARVLNEINFGVSVQRALENLSTRVDSNDVKFFVISVMMQRETGGNLVEILQNLSTLIRERFKFRGRVRALSAQGRLSAFVLVALPFAVAFIISIINPKFYDAFYENASAKYLLGFGLVWMAIGVFFLKRMVAIKV